MSRRQWFVSLCGGTFYVLFLVSVGYGKTIYVDAGAGLGGDGVSWGTAYKYLQDALHEPPVYGDEIWVAAGTYRPDEDGNYPNGSGDRTVTFQMINNVTIRGGYAGYSQPDPNQRDLNIYATILSGDLNNDDGLDFSNYSDNTYQIVTGCTDDAICVLDGLVITSGNANGEYPYTKGAGMLNYNSDPILIDCILQRHFASDGGSAMYNNEDSDPVLIRCHIIENEALKGGVIQNRCYSRSYFYNCILSNNYADVVVNYLTSWPKPTNCIIRDNDGYGISVSDGGASICNCTIVNNQDWGIFSDDDSPLVVENSILWGNASLLSNREKAQISGDYTVLNYSCVEGLTGNLGGEGNIGQNPKISADGKCILQPDSPCLDAGNNDFPPSDRYDLDKDGNTTESIPLDLYGNPRFRNDPLTPDTGYGVPPIIDIGACEGPYPGFWVSDQILEIPEGSSETTFEVTLLQDPGTEVQVSVNHGTGDNSITVISGNSLTFNSSDYFQPKIVTLAANPDDDFWNGIAQIFITADGYVTQNIKVRELDDETVPEVIHIDSVANGLATGVDWTNAFTDLQQAMALANTYSQIKELRIAQGIYTPAEWSGNRKATFLIYEDLVIKGGYAGIQENNPDERDFTVFKTILSGDLNNNDGPDFSNIEDNSYHVVTVNHNDTKPLLSGLTFSAGYAFGRSGNRYGGGIYLENSDPNIMDCCFIDNYAFDGGGGLFSNQGNPTLILCHFENNKSSRGGGAYLKSFDGVIDNCHFLKNQTGEWNGGAGIYFYDQSNSIVSNCLFQENEAGDGAGIYNRTNSSLTLTNCDFIKNNTISGHGAAIYNQDNSHLNAMDCTFCENSAHSLGGSIFNYQNSFVELNGCLLARNHADSRGGAITDYNSSTTLINCDILDNVTYDGGGLYTLGSTLSVTNCNISSNRGRSGGAIYCQDNGTIELKNCRLVGNHASQNGGGIYCQNSNLVLQDCEISKNFSESKGGALACWLNSSTDLQNCLIASNQAWYGGAIAGYSDSEIFLKHCTLAQNGSIEHGGALFCEQSTVHIENSILWSNFAETYGSEMALESASNVEINYSDISTENETIYHDIDSSISWQIGNINKNSLFHNASNEDILAYWRLDKNLLDSSPFQNHGTTNQTSLSFWIGQVMRALYFNDIQDVINVGEFDELSQVTEFTISFWIRPASVPFSNHEGIIGFGNALQLVPWIFGLQGTDHLYVQFSTLNGSSVDCNFDIGPVAQDIWTHVVITWDGNLCKSYLNSQFTNSDETENSILAEASIPNYLGYIDGYGHWNGNIDEVLILRYSLSDDLIQELYQEQLAGYSYTGIGPYNKDYHLKSAAGRWDPNSESWVIDSVTSPCIDKGNPGYELGEEPASIHNVRINMGVYGGTSEASKTPAGWGLLADLTNDGIVNGEDFGWQAGDWLETEEEQPEDLNRDGIIDVRDLRLTVEDWLDHTSWYE